MKKWFILLVVAALAAGGAWYLKQRPARPNAKAGAQQATTALAERRAISFVVDATGDIGPADQVSVRPEINGRISVLTVDVGDPVKRGDLLFALDDQDLQTQRASRVTEIEGARLQFERAERNYERGKELFATSLIAKEQFDDLKTELELARNAQERARRSLEQIDDQLSKTKILAPFDCTILTRPISVGQAVSGAGGFNSGTEVLTVADLTRMIVNAHVNQADVARLKAGMGVEVEVEAVPGLNLKGVIERIAPQATIKNNIKGFATLIRLTSLDARVRPGMTANLHIPLPASESVLTVPISAVFSERGVQVVYVQSGAGFEARPVRVGASDIKYAEIVEGVREGESVSLVRPSNGVVTVAPSGEPPGGRPAGMGSRPLTARGMGTNAAARAH
jgi:HlyD family secretion protein